MTDLTLDLARKILDGALAQGLDMKLNPLAVAVLDARGCLKAFAAQDGTSLKRGEIAHGKAYGALSLGMGSRTIFNWAGALATAGHNQIGPLVVPAPAASRDETVIR